VADALRRETGVEVEVTDGGKGEFTVSADGQVVARKDDALPPVDEVLAAVKKTGTTAGTGV
jgi:hypothetical protein